MLAPPKYKAQEGGVKSEMFGYLRIINGRYYQSSDFLLKLFESICSLRKSRIISKFLDSFIQTLIMRFLFLPS